MASHHLTILARHLRNGSSISPDSHLLYVGGAHIDQSKRLASFMISPTPHNTKTSFLRAPSFSKTLALTNVSYEMMSRGSQRVFKCSKWTFLGLAAEPYTSTISGDRYWHTSLLTLTVQWCSGLSTDAGQRTKRCAFTAKPATMNHNLTT